MELVSYFLLLLLCGSTWSFAHSSHHALHNPMHYYHPQKSFHHLIGVGKGDNVTGIQEVKSYLQRFGYLNNFKDKNYQVDDHFDDSLEHALLTFQDFFSLNKTGILDIDTISLMSQPRCGNPDIVNATDTNGEQKNSFRTHYVLKPNKPKWISPNLIVLFEDNVPSQFVETIDQAFLDWEPFVPLMFFKLTKTLQLNNVAPDIRVGFYKGDHGDRAPFDGPLNVLAHQIRLQVPIIHFDAEENWVVGAVHGGLDVRTVARHEIGHLLGLAHSNDEAAIMYPIIRDGKVKQIADDDKAGVKAIYFGQ